MINTLSQYKASQDDNGWPSSRWYQESSDINCAKYWLALTSMIKIKTRHRNNCPQYINLRIKININIKIFKHSNTSFMFVWRRGVWQYDYSQLIV